jgi:small subunit ribosomal protein S9
MPEDPKRPADDAPEDEAPETVDAPPAASDAPGPEIEGVEELAGAVAPESEDATPAEAENVEGEAPKDEPAQVEPAPEGEAPEGETEAAPEGEVAEAPPRQERPRPGRRRGGDDAPAEEVIPGAHLEPDLVLEEERRESEGEYAQYGEYAQVDAEAEAEAALPAEEGVPAEEPPAEPEPVVRQPLDLARDARYVATGKRKSAVARVILRPGEGTYRINGRHLDEFFPRVRLQRMARQPLEVAGYNARLDVVASVHGGGVSAQATALRHGVARALVEADPALRGELKRRGYLTRDPRVKERKKAGLKKARKRPQFSKR